MSELDVRLIGTDSIRNFYSEVFVASYLKSISHDSINDRDLETVALQALRIAEVATRIRASADVIEI
jgi:hypothetical protein